MPDKRKLPESPEVARHLDAVLLPAIELARSEILRKQAETTERESVVVDTLGGQQEMPEHLARGLDEFIQAARDALLEKQARAANEAKRDAPDFHPLKDYTR